MLSLAVLKLLLENWGLLFFPEEMIYGECIIKGRFKFTVNFRAPDKKE